MSDWNWDDFTVRPDQNDAVTDLESKMEKEKVHRSRLKQKVVSTSLVLSDNKRYKLIAEEQHKQIEKLKQCNNDILSKNKDLYERNNILEQQVDELKLKNENLSNAHSKCRLEDESKEMYLNQLKLHVKDIDMKCAALEVENKLLASEKTTSKNDENLRKKIKTLEKDGKLLIKFILSLEAYTKGLSNHQVSKFKQFRSRMENKNVQDELFNDADDKSESTDLVIMQRDELKLKVDCLSNELHKYQLENENKEKCIDQLKLQIKDVDLKCAALELENTLLASEISTSDKEENLKKKIEKLEQDGLLLLHFIVSIEGNTKDLSTYQACKFKQFRSQLDKENLQGELFNGIGDKSESVDLVIMQRDELKIKVEHLSKALSESQIEDKSKEQYINQLKMHVKELEMRCGALQVENKLLSSESITSIKDENPRKKIKTLEKDGWRLLNFIVSLEGNTQGLSNYQLSMFKQFRSRLENKNDQDELFFNDTDDKSNSVDLCSSVDTGRGSSLLSTDDETGSNLSPPLPMNNNVYTPLSKSYCDVSTSPCKNNVHNLNKNCQTELLNDFNWSKHTKAEFTNKKCQTEHLALNCPKQPKTEVKHAQVQCLFKNYEFQFNKATQTEVKTQMSGPKSNNRDRTDNSKLTNSILFSPSHNVKLKTVKQFVKHPKANIADNTKVQNKKEAPNLSKIFKEMALDFKIITPIGPASLKRRKPIRKPTTDGKLNAIIKKLDYLTSITENQKSSTECVHSSNLNVPVYKESDQKEEIVNSKSTNNVADRIQQEIINAPIPLHSSVQKSDPNSSTEISKRSQEREGLTLFNRNKTNASNTNHGNDAHGLLEKITLPETVKLPIESKILSNKVSYKKVNFVSDFPKIELVDRVKDFANPETIKEAQSSSKKESLNFLIFGENFDDQCCNQSDAFTLQANHTAHAVTKSPEQIKHPQEKSLIYPETLEKARRSSQTETVNFKNVGEQHSQSDALTLEENHAVHAALKSPELVNHPQVLRDIDTVPIESRKRTRQPKVTKLEALKQKMSKNTQKIKCDASPPKKKQKIVPLTDLHYKDSYAERNKKALEKALKIISEEKANQELINKVVLPATQCRITRSRSSKIVTVALQNQINESISNKSSSAKSIRRSLRRKSSIESSNDSVKESTKNASKSMPNSIKTPQLQILLKSEPIVEVNLSDFENFEKFNTRRHNEKCGSIGDFYAKGIKAVECIEKTVDSAKKVRYSSQTSGSRDNLSEKEIINDITTENSDALSGKSVFARMVTKYSSLKFKHPKARDRDNNIPYSVIDKYVSSAIECEVGEEKIEIMNEAIKSISKMKPKHFIGGLIVYMMHENRIKDVTCLTYTPPAPPMTKNEQVLLYILRGLEKEWPEQNIIEKLLESVEYTLFKLNSTPELPSIETLSRLYAVICREKKMLSKLRMFMLNALYCLTYKAIVLSRQCLQVWRNVLPSAKSAQGNDFIVFAMVYLLYFYKSDNNVGVADAAARMRDCLTRKYQFTPFEWSENIFLGKIKEYLQQAGEKNNLEKNLFMLAVLCFAKRGGTDWTQRKLVDEIFFPALDSNTIEVSKLSIQVLGGLLRPFPNAMKFHAMLSIKKMIHILNETECKEVQETIIQSLIMVRRHNWHQLMEIILHWQPQQISPYTERIFQSFVREKGISMWTQSLNKLSNPVCFDRK